jgi:serine/threonine protein phosphatase PrpC
MLVFAYSGSTCVSVITMGKKIYVANVGDSRGIVIQSANNPNDP